MLLRADKNAADIQTCQWISADLLGCTAASGPTEQPCILHAQSRRWSDFGQPEAHGVDHSKNVILGLQSKSACLACHSLLCPEFYDNRLVLRGGHLTFCEAKPQEAGVSCRGGSVQKGALPRRRFWIGLLGCKAVSQTASTQESFDILNACSSDKLCAGALRLNGVILDSKKNQVNGFF